jgi:hypothetical protein
MIRKPKKPKPDQHKLFVNAAKELECDVSEAAFDKTLKKVGKPAKGKENKPYS